MIRKIIDREMLKLQDPNVGTVEWDVNNVEAFAAIVGVRAVLECLCILADKGCYEGGAVDSFNTIVERFNIVGATYDELYYRDLDNESTTSESQEGK